MHCLRSSRSVGDDVRQRLQQGGCCQAAGVFGQVAASTNTVRERVTRIAEVVTLVSKGDLTELSEYKKIDALGKDKWCLP